MRNLNSLGANLLRRASVLLACIAAALAAPEHATFNSAGALTGFIHDGAELPIGAAFEATFEGGITATLQPHDQRTPIERSGNSLTWQGLATFENGSQAQFAVTWSNRENGVAFEGSATAGGPPAPYSSGGHWSFPLDLVSLDYVIDLPRERFVGGSVNDEPLTATQSAEHTLFRADTNRIVVADGAKNWTLTFALDHSRPVTLTDTWDKSGRHYRIRVELHNGRWPTGDTAKLAYTVDVAGRAAAAPAHIVVNPAVKLYPFDGFGGDYCFNNDSPVVDYTLANLDVAWARCEFKASAWDAQRDNPGPELKRDFELMQTLQRRHIPWVLSVWRLPERYYSDPNAQKPGTFGRHIAPDRWPEFVDLLGSYLVYAKEKYGVEPDLFSFNEPDLGVDIGFTGETHRDAIKRLGTAFAHLGLKTKLLLGDTANPRDSHKFVLPTAADPSALQYVGALSVHSWGNGTPEQYRAWGDVAEWLQRPLLVAEAGLDPSAWRNHLFDSYAYGLREASQFQELLRYARPRALIYWEYNADYGLVNVAKDGSIEPTGRFWLMKQFSNLIPHPSHAVESQSDQPDVLVSAFGSASTLTLHVLNTGAARRVTVHGLPSGAYDTVTTTETTGFQRQGTPAVDSRGDLTLDLPARCLVSLVQRTEH